MAATKAEAEREVFREFAPLIGLKVKEGSIRSPAPPAPDIACELQDGRPFCAELVSLDDPTTRTTRSSSAGTKLAWHDAAKAWPAEQQAELLELSRDLQLLTGFVNEAGSRERRRVFTEVQRLLLTTLPRDYAGQLVPRLREAGLGQVVNYMAVHRGGVTGIRISAFAGSGVPPPNFDALRAKLNHKPYVSEVPVHLFAHSTWDSPDSHVNSLRDLVTLVEGHSAVAPFAAVHFFDWVPRHLRTVNLKGT